MPPRGEFADLNPDLPLEWQQFAKAVRHLILCIDLSYREIAKDIYRNKNALLGLTSGKLKHPPEVEMLESLHELAIERAGAEAVISWEELDRLWRALAPSLPEDGGPAPAACCPDCGTAVFCPNCGASLPREEPATAAKPANSLSAIAADVVPVPRHTGDRHNGRTVDEVWLAAKDLAVYISAGNFERANGLIRHVGTEATPNETAAAIASCRDLGLGEAADIIINYAGSRPDRDVLQILRALNRRDRRIDADALLHRALSATHRSKLL
ncbi:zinc ribbon domain-containing protein [Nocardia abscessus]|uniref:Zinc ribbon domain-containing protein n=1 Tax=Nocardia abscessus TaxID=120957 RepID=A0ABS0C9E3_9NOCA|nr:zinc ribbon domain-containing protein [Nocardia abscessus]MBF6225284.1 zinc ribbon domain-containing protein [Nocardia abscessus]